MDKSTAPVGRKRMGDLKLKPSVWIITLGSKELDNCLFQSLNLLFLSSFIYSISEKDRDRER